MESKMKKPMGTKSAGKGKVLSKGSSRVENAKMMMPGMGRHVRDAIGATQNFNTRA